MSGWHAMLSGRTERLRNGADVGEQNAKVRIAAGRGGRAGRKTEGCLSNIFGGGETSPSAMSARNCLRRSNSVQRSVGLSPKDSSAAGDSRSDHGASSDASRGSDFI
jgi:hypothetical protein